MKCRETYLVQKGHASGGQSGGHSLQHSELEQHSSAVVTSPCGLGSEADLLLAKFAAPMAPAATSGIPTTANHSHFLLLMGTPLEGIEHQSHSIDAGVNLCIHISFKGED
jgi:hypothetical protein